MTGLQGGGRQQDYAQLQDVWILRMWMYTVINLSLEENLAVIPEVRCKPGLSALLSHPRGRQIFSHVNSGLGGVFLTGRKGPRNDHFGLT